MKYKTSNTLKLLFKYYSTNDSYMFYIDDTHIGFNHSEHADRFKTSSYIFKHIIL